eukprot:3937000-Amphidinium_carterae.1
MEQHFACSHADYKVKWDSAAQHCKEVAESRRDCQGLDSGLATQALRQLKLDGQSQKDNVETAREFGDGDLCVRCGEAVEDLEHIAHHCPAWAAERREVALPASALKAPPCAKLQPRLWFPGLLGPSEKWSTVCQAVRNFWLLVGPKMRIRSEQWPRVRLPAPEGPELVPEVVETVATAALPAAPFGVGPHQRVVEHETYLTCAI